jgi:hypothetical protein
MGARSMSRLSWVLLLALLVPTVAASGWAQTSTGGLRGRVMAEDGTPVAAATIMATETATGLQRSTLSQESGAYMLVGLRPGTYELRVSSLGMGEFTRTVQVLVGQMPVLDIQLAPQALALEGLTVVGRRLTETMTSEVATNITPEQVASLPQQDRNFLNFAGLAPGVTVGRDEMNKQITAGGLPATRINVFIDGASFKNDILEGGVHGQDASRGNPFPQIAIQEFRVVTQNFKAEHQRAGSAVVTATTRSGTNRFEMSGFVLGQNKGLVGLDPGAVILCDEAKARDEACAPKPEYERWQAGLSLGGPIVQDRLHYFAGYEGNYQNREARVVAGRPEFRDRFGQYEGAFSQPFRSNLFFGKLSYVPGANQTLDLSYNGRFESDKRGFGGQTSFESAEDVRIGYNVLTLQHSIARGDWFNQSHVSAQRSTWNPTAVNDDQEIGQVYEGVIRIGARSTEQKFVQDRLALRNDLTYSGLRWAGEHLIKGGINVDFLHYDVAKRFSGNPEFVYNPAVSMDVPIRASWGSGDPGMSERNVQFGWFIQDDWDVTPRLQLNLGLRWDAETNLFNNRWVTPDSIRQRLGAHVPDGFFTRGTEDRPIYLGAFQPRLGFSYDLSGTGRTVVHGGFGIYYDREVWNHLLDERFRLQWQVRTVEFTATDEAGKVPWRTDYLSRQGLQSLVDEANPNVTAEVFLLLNSARPPRSNQWNLGVRQVVGDYNVGATYRGVRGYNTLSWYCGLAHSEHGYCEGGREQGLPYDPILATDEGRTWYDALDLTAEKPFAADSPWGVSVTYTLASAHRKGMDFFTLDFPGVAPADWPKVRQSIERHRVVASGIVGLPYGFRASTLVQLGSGAPFARRDETNGWGPRRVQVDFASQDPPTFRQIDLRVQKDFMVPGSGKVGLVAEAINVFNHDNFRCYEELAVFGDGTRNERFGKPQPWCADPGRRLQFGLNFGF